MLFNAWKITAFLFFSLLLTVTITMIFKETNYDKTLKVWTRFQAISADPMDYDLDVHHIMMRSTMASLVSVYKNSSIEPQVAKSWSSNNDHTLWNMVIDEDWTFDNGDHVTPEIVLKSFKRVLLLKNKSKSDSGLLEFLVGAKDLRKLDDEIEGLKISGNVIVFKFVLPMQGFLEKVSFGIYAISHPDDYDDHGTWKNKKQVTSLGRYRIKKWSDREFELELRKNLKANTVDSNKKIKRIVFSFDSNPNFDELDIVVREKYAPSLESLDWSYGSTTQDNSITYIKVMKWDDPNSEFSSREYREKIRNIYYNNLAQSGLDVVTSFFPLSIKGIKPFVYKKGTFLDLKGKKISTQPFFFNPDKRYSKKELGQVFDDAFKLLAREINAVPVKVDYPEKEEDEKKVFDIQFLGTGILIDDPMDDVRFMFLSKQGIRLPDETGEIIDELKKETFDIQKINSLIWEQAIIWPVRHYSMGFWTNHASNLDISEMNLTLHPIDFQFLKWN